MKAISIFQMNNAFITRDNVIVALETGTTFLHMDNFVGVLLIKMVIVNTALSEKGIQINIFIFFVKTFCWYSSEMSCRGNSI